MSTDTRAVDYNPSFLQPSAIATQPIVPTRWKVGLVFTLGIQILLINLICFTVYGSLHLNVAALSIASGVLGICQITSTARKIVYYRERTRQLEIEREMQLNIPNLNPTTTTSTTTATTTTTNTTSSTTPQTASSTPPRTQPRPALSGPTPDRWNSVLNLAQPETGTRLYNLDNPQQSVPYTRFNLLQLPMAGEYYTGYGTSNIKAAFCLPPAHIACFPAPVADWVTRDCTDIHCFFMIFDVSSLPKGQNGWIKCNLALHNLAFPDYDPQFPFRISPNSGTWARQEGGLQTNMQICMHVPIHITSNPDIYDQQAIRIDGFVPTGMRISIHNGNNPNDLCFSPDNAYFFINGKQPLAGSYFVAKVGNKKAIALQALFINNSESLDAQKLALALHEGNNQPPNHPPPTPSQFLKNLKTLGAGFTILPWIQQIFRHPTRLTQTT